MSVLSKSNADIQDVEQVLVRGRLSLDVLVSVGEGQATVKDLLFFGWENGLNIDFDVVDEEPAIAQGGGNIDRIVRLSRKPVTSYELAVTDGDLDRMRASLIEVERAQQVDLAIQAEGINRRSKRLVMLDVDSTLIQDEMIELLAEAAGAGDKVKAITASAMAGEIDFETSLRERVRTLAGLDESAIAAARERMRLTPGA